MGDLLTFMPRPAVPATPPASSPAKTRRMIEEAAQSALDTADNLLAILDRMDGDTDSEDGADAEPSLAAPENHHGSQVVWLRGSDADREAEAPEIVLQDMPAEPDVLPFAPLSWCGSGNVVAAAGVALLNIVGRR
ncbi:hypothetical protein MKK64_10280 [Methylobacterium sp. E-025]|uniref:hypothetical protein n=1 Tax=Methylobacterium sp. E-025 TaxID=2836561 RepID=UPI001FBBFB93|nr:hypothetical protein [Methylobacterium sp. E-025]MCJ2111579.1 hypothetical protein [Methylobacterium sp. E-025]